MNKDTMINHEEWIMQHTGPGRFLQIQELVRCQDCLYWKPEPASSAAPLFHRCAYHAFKNYCSMADDFCSKALKRE